MGIFSFLCMIYVAYKIVGEEWGMGDFYRSMGQMYEKEGLHDLAKGQYKRANDSDCAVALCLIFLVIVGIFFIITIV